MRHSHNWSRLPSSTDPDRSLEPISSPRNARVLAAGRLQRVRGRRETGNTVIEGPHVLAEAIAGGAAVSEVFGLETDADAEQLAEASGAEWVPVTQRVLEKLATTESPRGPVAVVAIPDDVPISGDSVWIDTSDPGNAGTIIRTAAAFGLSVVVASDAVDPWSPKVLRAASGGHFRTHVSVGPPPPVQTVATVVEGGVPLDEVGALLGADPMCILVGNESHGLSAEMVDGAALAVTIPMAGGIESLNAGIAAAILMVELARHRGWEIGSGA